MDLSSTYQKPAKMSFSIENLAKSSRDEKSEHTQPAVINFNDSMFTPVKLQSDISPMTSTPLSLPYTLPNSNLKLKKSETVHLTQRAAALTQQTLNPETAFHLIPQLMIQIATHQSPEREPELPLPITKSMNWRNVTKTASIYLLKNVQGYLKD
ncbi:unnamed protein product [Mytilus coruscus]|uniref:Uncharacterized protein n=1 Tax=Mytilus coruscus TaxID=42192 RepID=A0A6J8AQM7_MYTCO|nr:unnamed protein product [Mytilus coruscus]